MKKIISIILMAAVMLSIGITAAAKDNMLSIGNWSAVSYRADYGCAKLTYLSKSAWLKNNTLEVAEDEFLLVPKGVKLYLDNGAVINGSVYIANGGYLFIRGGEVEVCAGGSIYADGYISIGAECDVTLDRSGEIFINKVGSLRVASDASFDANSLGNIICMGRTNSSSDLISKKLAAAFLCDANGVSMAETPQTLLPSDRNYASIISKINTGTNQRIVFVFDKGACLTTNTTNGKFRFIGNTCIGIAGSYLYNDDFGNEINRIVTINGIDYVADISVGGYTIEMTDKLVPVDFYENGNVMSQAVNNISQHKYLGTSQASLPVYFAAAGANLYLMDNGYILAIKPCENSTSENSSQFYDVALYMPV